MGGTHSLVGKTVAGRFRVVDFIGEGAMAAVFRAEQDDEPRLVALKVMHPQLAVDRTFLRRFEREAKAAARLKHGNTVQIIAFGLDGSQAYIAMELLGGQDLFDVLARERRLSEVRAARIVIQACEALAAAHHQGIVHRDLKPENIMLSPSQDDPTRDHVKVLDFGIAKILDRDEQGSDNPPSSMPSSALTTVGVVVGTPGYMSPEQCRGEAIDGRSDIYACGVLLFQLVTGRTPFIGDSPFEVAMAHVRSDPPRPSSFAMGLHPRLEDVIMKALAKWPAQRQQTARELQDELTALLPELSTTRRQAGLGLASRPGEMDGAGAEALPGVPTAVTITSQDAGSARTRTAQSPHVARDAPQTPRTADVAPPPQPKVVVPAVVTVAPAVVTKEAPVARDAVTEPPGARGAITQPVPRPAAVVVARRRRSVEVPLWALVPLAALIGVTLALIAYVLSR